MKITVNRIKSNANETLSTISIDGKFQCFGLEDEYRLRKVQAETRIPCGTYRVGVRTVGGFHEKYKSSFPTHRGMLHILDVPDFEYVLIHIGNKDEDTAGCLIVGAGVSAGTEILLSQSTGAYLELYSAAIDAALAGDLTIEYIDNDR